MFICNVCLLAHCIRYLCCIGVYSDSVGQIGPAYSIFNDHVICVYVVYAYACHYNYKQDYISPAAPAPN